MAKATTKKIEETPLEDKMQALANAMATLSESVSTINERLSELEPKVERVLPREGPVPIEVWLSLDKETVVANALKGCIEGILANAPLHNLGDPNMQAEYARIAVGMAEVFLLEVAKKKNQVNKGECCEQSD
jgi:hypothetical protein